MISCNQHDYIEIVCMHHYPLTLTLKSGELIHGTAQDTQRNIQREECIKIIINNDEYLIPLNNIKTLQVCVTNPHLQTVTFD